MILNGCETTVEGGYHNESLCFPVPVSLGFLRDRSIRSSWIDPSCSSPNARTPFLDSVPALTRISLVLVKFRDEGTFSLKITADCLQIVFQRG